MKRKLLLFVLLSTGFLLNAQNDYNFTVTNEAYQNLTGSTSLNGSQVWDDPDFTIPLGFSFQMSTHTFSTIYIPSWSYGGTLSSSLNLSGILPVLLPVGQDVIDLGFNSGSSLSNISYVSEGSPGSRILKIEWNNAGFFNDQSASDFINFQVWLHETTNIVEYRFGTNSVNNSISYQGETGLIVGLYPSIHVNTSLLQEEGYMLSGNPSNPTVNVFQTNQQPPSNNLAINGAPPSGTVYRFTPQNLSVGDFENLDVTIYPNPVSHSLNINTNTPDYEIEIYNSVGQKINRFLEVNGIVDVSALSSGLYFIRILTASASATQKFVKQ